MHRAPPFPPRATTLWAVEQDISRASRARRSAAVVIAALCTFVAAAALVAAARPATVGEPPRAGLQVAATAASRPLTAGDAARELDRLTARIAQAHFRTALAELNALRPRLERSDDDSTAVQRALARLEVLAATLHLAMGSERDASRALGRALIRDPRLQLDAARHPPRLVRALERARRAPQEPGAQVEASDLTRAGDAPPRLLRAVPPLVPPSAGAATLHPTIVCRLRIDSTGAVADAQVYLHRPDLQSYERAALQAVREFRFQPAQRAGLPVATWIQWPVRFP